MNEICRKIRDGVYENKMLYPVMSMHVNREHLDEARKQFKLESRRLEKEFEKDLIVGYDVADNPKAEKCFSLAWEYGHANGLEEVVNHFEDFVQLIKEDN